ncbi:MAG: hypothetical protein ACOZNI_09520 [Myxococcota bacterium]
MILLFLACAPVDDTPCPPGFVVDIFDGACVFDEDSVVDVVVNMDSSGLVRVNAEPFVQVMGPAFERNVWVSPVPSREEPGADALALYLAIDPEDPDGELWADFPVGTLLVHETVNREEGHTVQVKRDDWLDENGRGWWFGKYYDDGTKDENACTPCVACHNGDTRPGTEGLWGVPHHAR